MFNQNVFREYDIRGIVDKDLSEDLAYRIGRAYVRFAEKEISDNPIYVAVGRDCRLSGERYAKALMLGLQSNGASILELGPVSTPMSYFSVFQKKKCDGSIMVTGSHNPPDYNGFKICVGEKTLFKEDIQTLRKYVSEDNDAYNKKEPLLSQKHDIFPEYKKFILENIQLKKQLRVCVDAGNGIAGSYAPEIFESLGCEVIKLFCEPDGNFPNHEADPSVDKNLLPLIDAVKKEKADLGIAFDGDGDRIGVIDENGNIIRGDKLLIIFARELIKKNPGATVISEVKSSNLLYEDIKKCGGTPIMWKTGHSIIKAKMKETKALLAGEMSGHIFFADKFFGFDDAIYAGARLLEILSQKDKPISSLLSNIAKTESTPEIRIDCSDDTKFQLVEKLKEKFISDHKVNTIDGIRIEFENGWALVRASNTQPAIVMRFEALTKENLQKIKSFVEEKAKEIGLPIK